MAGSIIISKDNVWSDSTLMLDRIALRTSEAFLSECEKFKKEIFSPVDVFQFIALDELDADGFKCFCWATNRAFERFRGQSGSDFS
jgi:hypothetical protein